jgi:hypothetical protein
VTHAAAARGTIPCVYALRRVLALAAVAAGAAAVVGAVVALLLGASLPLGVAWALVAAGVLLAVYPVFMFSGARPRPPLGFEGAYARHGLHRPRSRADRAADLLGTAAAGLVVLAAGIGLLLVAA